MEIMFTLYWMKRKAMKQCKKEAALSSQLNSQWPLRCCCLLFFCDECFCMEFHDNWHVSWLPVSIIKWFVTTKNQNTFPFGCVPWNEPCHFIGNWCDVMEYLLYCPNCNDHAKCQLVLVELQMKRKKKW